MTTEDGRIGRVEGILEEVRTRLNSMENRFDGLESRTEGRFNSLESRIEGRFNALDSMIDRLESRMQTQFYWVIGVIITMWVTIILTVLLRM